MSDWPEVRLEDITTILGDGLHGTPEYDDQGEYYFINGNNLENGRILINEKTKRASEAEYLKHRKNLNDRTILVSINGTIGNVALYNGEKVFLGKSACYFNVKEDVDKQFVRYVMSGRLFQNYINSLATGSTIKNVSLKLMRDFSFRLPPLEIQKAISKVLKDLDDKIELNRQTNQTLEQIAQAIFKSWFVDFEPTRAKIQAKKRWQALNDTTEPNSPTCYSEELDTPNPAQQQPNLTLDQAMTQAAMAAISGKTIEEVEQLSPEQQQQLKTIADLFPDALVESELGWIPEGWEVSSINEISEHVAMGPFGSDIKTETFVDEGVPVINGQQLRGIMLEDADNKFISESHADKLKKSNVHSGDLVITHRGTLGQVSIVPEGAKYERYVISQSQCYIRPNRDKVSPLFLAYYFNSYLGQHELLAYKSQVGVPAIAKPVTNLRKIELVLPSMAIATEFQVLCGVMHRFISDRREQIRVLAELRDTLLPKLLYGEINLDSNPKELEATE